MRRPSRHDASGARVSFSRASALLLAALAASAPLLAEQHAPDRRTAEAAVLLNRLPGTIHDLPQCMLFSLGFDGPALDRTAFCRQPYELSDGTLMVQTAATEPAVYVRQVIEHPLATRTVVVFEEEAVRADERAARVVAMADLALLNPDRPVFAFGAGETAVLHGGRAPSTAVSGREAWSILGAGRPASAVLAWLLGLARMPTPTAAPGDPVFEAATRAALQEMLDRADPVMETLLDAQALVVVELIERDIRRAVGRDASITDARIEELNRLQERLAAVLGAARTSRVVFDPEYGPTAEALSILALIDRVAGTATQPAFTAGLEAIRVLFLDRVPRAVAQSRVGTARSLVEAVGPGSIVFAEVPTDGLYDLIRASLESSSFNLIVMSSATGEAGVKRGDVAGAMAASPGPHPTPVMRAAHVDRSLSPAGLSLAVEELRIGTAAMRLAPGSATVTYRLEEERISFVGVASREDGYPARARLLVVPARSPREVGALVATLTAAGAIDTTEARILAQWALVAQAAVDL